MLYSNYCYIDTAIGGVNTRNNVIKITELKDYENKVDAYKTLFRFNIDYYNHFKKQNSVKGYSGAGYIDYFPFDIDDDNLSVAYDKTRYAIEILNIDFEYDVHYLFFSGAKGFHVLIPSQCFGIFKPSDKLPGIFRKISQDLLPDTCDTSIYEINRLFRLNNTINSKTKLYKIALTRQDFDNGIDYIKELAQTPNKTRFLPLHDNVTNAQFRELYTKYEQNNLAEKTKEKTNIYEYFQGVGEGQRDVTATKIAGILKAKDMEVELCYQILAGWNLQNNPPLEENQLKKVIDSVYSYHDKNGVENEIYPIWSIFDEYKDYIQISQKVNIGIPEIDQKIRGVRPGQIMTIMGYTGNFKTAVIQNILRHYHSYSKEPVLFFQLEMPRLEIFERAIQMERELAGDEVEKMFEDGSYEMIIDEIKTKLENFYVVDKSGLSFTEIAKYVKIAEEKIYKRKTGLIGIDFIQLMSGEGITNAQKIDEVAKQCKKVMKNLNIPVIQVSQVTGVENNHTPIVLNDSRDSKTINIMSDYMVGIWMNEEQTHQIIALLKNRKGGLCKIKRKINKKSLRFGESYEIT